MTNNTHTAKEQFIQGITRISHFWGFPKAMGAIYGAVYLSKSPFSLDEMVAEVGVSKGAVSTNIRQLERLGMVHKHIKLGERKDYYIAETDFWAIVRGILQKRGNSEFDKAITTIGESMNLLDDNTTEEGEFYRRRIQTMQSFFTILDSFVEMVIKFESLVALLSLKSLVEKRSKE